MNSDYKKLFVEESVEQLEQLDEKLLALERSPEDKSSIHTIFRIAHTFKGGSSFIGLTHLSNYCHKIENLLSKIRDDEIPVTPYVIELLFKSFDIVKDTINRISAEEPGIEEKKFDAEELEKLLSGDTAALESSQENTETGASQMDNEQKLKLTPDDVTHLEEALLDGKSIYFLKVNLVPDVQLKWVRAELIYENIDRVSEILKSFPERSEFKDEKFDLTMEFLVITDEEEDAVVKSADVNQVKDVEANRLEKGDLELLKVSFEDGEKSDVEKAEAETEIEELPVEEVVMEKKIEEIEQKKEEKTPPKQETKQETKKEKPKVEKEQKQSQPKETSASGTGTETQTKVSSKTAGEPKSSPSTTMTSRLTSQTVKVPISKLDELLNLVGELAIINSGFVDTGKKIEERLKDKNVIDSLNERIDNLSSVLKVLQEGIMESRMVPVGEVFSRFPRIVRDLAKSFNKQIHLEMKGEETRLDKKIVDSLVDPLIHIIRNSIDHGIEISEERIKNDKNAEGKILLEAYQKGNNILIECSDDGKGLSSDKILDKAVRNGLISETEEELLSEEEVFDLIFEKGFSTRDEVSELSGRGVGMDVVRTTVTSLNGAVSVRSEENQGTKIIMSFPLTLAIIPSMIVSNEGVIYAIPLSSIEEIASEKKENIKNINFKKAIKLHGQIVPLLKLKNLLSDSEDSEFGNENKIVVINYEDKPIGIIVDKILGKKEIVIKTLSKNFKEVDGIAGATILGDGTIALIIDVNPLVKKSVIEMNRKSGMAKSSKKSDVADDKKLNTQKTKSNKKKRKMKKKSIEDIPEELLSEFHFTKESLPHLIEIINEAMKKVSTNLSNFLGKKISTTIPPNVSLDYFESFYDNESFKGAENTFFSSVEITEGLNGKIVLALDEDSMRKLFSDFIGDDLHSDLAQSSLMEISNMVAAGIVNTFSKLLTIKSVIEPPIYHYQTLDEYFNVLMEEIKMRTKYLWSMEADFVYNEKMIRGKIYIIPFDDSFKQLGTAIQHKHG